MFGTLEIIFTVLIGIFILATGIAMLIIWHKRHRKDFVFETLKIGLIGVLAVVVFYIAFKVLNIGGDKEVETATTVLLSIINNI